MTTHHIANYNIARAVAPLDSPTLASFVTELERINAVADRTPGFVWRLQDDSGNATSINPFGDERLIINMSLWEYTDALFDFTYRSTHADTMARRREWFEPHDGPALVLWWVAAGHIPTPEEGAERLERLVADGPSDYAFTFKQRFPQPDGSNRT